MNRRYRKLSMEQMEAREMMAGDVAAFVSNGNLYLNEAPGQAGRDNNVIISQIAPGRIRVTGNILVGDGTDTKINGAAFQDFDVPGGLYVNFGGGNDGVVFDPKAPPTFGDVSLNLAAPPVLVRSMTSTGASFVGTPINPDKDIVEIWAGTIRGSLTINTGADNDWIDVRNATIGDGVGVDNVTINSGTGADVVQLYEVNVDNGNIDIQTFDSPLEADADNVWLQDVHAIGGIGIRTGGGNDAIHLDHVLSGSQGDLNLDAGAGDDTVELNYIEAVNNFMAKLGDGSDSLKVNDLFVDFGQTTIDGGNGVDSLTRSGAFPTSRLSQIGFEWINGRHVLSVLPPVLPSLATTSL
jgi:hypothetical protein